MPWQPLPLSYAVAIYPFQPSSSAAELPLQVGDQLYVIEQGGKDGAWCRGYLVAPPLLLSALNSGGRTASDARVFSGIFPKCCIEIREELGDDASARHSIIQPGSKPQAPVPMLKVGDESPTSSSEPLVDEISACLREWYISHLPELVLKRRYDLLDQMSAITTRLDYARRELLNDVLTAQERIGVQDGAVWDLVRGNKLLGTEIIVRDPKQQGRLLTGEDSAIEMTRLQSVMSLLNEAPIEKPQVTRLHHCVVEARASDGSGLESATLTIALYQRDQEGELRQYSESCTTLASSKLKTLFMDLSTRDFNEDDKLFLVVRLVITEPPKPVPKVVQERPPSRNGTVRGTKSGLIDRRRSSLIFGSKRKTDRPLLNPNGRIASQSRDRAATPSIPEESEMEEDQAPKVQINPVPRTIGAGIVDIAKIIASGKDESVEVSLWSHAGSGDESTEISTPILTQLYPSIRGKYVPCQRLLKVKVDLRPHQAPDADTLIRMNPTSMHQISKTQKIGFSEAPSRQRSDIYLTLNKAIIYQGSQLSHPELGSVPIKALALPNLQITMELRDTSGKRLDHSVFASSNGPGVTALRTQAIEVGQAWNQTICIRIPAHKVMETHLVLSVADAPEFPFALAWMPLWEKQIFMRDGRHSLILHAYDKTTSTFSQNGQGAYLALPWNHDNFVASHDGVAVPIASLELETRLCSTEISQNPVLASLFNWKNLQSPKLMDMLQKLFFVPEIEIVKQLREVLDELFAILEHKAGSSKFEDTIFNNIVFVLGIVHDRRFNLGPLVERYAEEHFRAPPIAPCFVRSWTRLLQSVSDPQSARDMRALFKVGKQFMKLLMGSYAQQKKAQSNGQVDKRNASFKEDMQAVLFGLQMMMRSETAALVGSKTLLVQNFHSWLPELLTAYSSDEVVKMAINFVDSCEEVTGKLTLYKLVLIQNYTRLEKIWDDPKDWKTLIRHCLRWLEPHWNKPDTFTDDWREQVRLCCSIVAELCKRPISLLRDFMPAVVSTYCYLGARQLPRKRTLSLLFSTTYPFAIKPLGNDEYFDEALLELSALLSELSNVSPPAGTRESTQPQTDSILDILTMIRSLLTGNACPASWLSLNVHHHYSAVNILGFVANQLVAFYLPPPEEAEIFDMELWKSYFETLLLLVASPALTLEAFSEQKRRAVWKIAADVRQSGAELLRQSWSALGWEATADDERRYGTDRLGGYQVQYVPGLVGPIIELCLSMHEGLRRVAVEILQTMIVSEWDLNEDLDMIETEVVGVLNNTLKAKDPSESTSSNEIVTRKLFIGELLNLFGTIANQPDDSLWTALEELVSTIEELIDLLTNGEEQTVALEPRPATVNGKRSVEIPDRSISRMEGKVYGTQALELYKQLAEEYERSGDFKRLARTHRAMARIHEARAANQMAGMDDLNGDVDIQEEDEEDSS